MRVKKIFPRFTLVAVLICCTLTACDTITDGIQEFKDAFKEVDAAHTFNPNAFSEGFERGYNAAYNKAHPENDGSVASDEKSASPTSTVNGSVEGEYVMLPEYSDMGAVLSVSVEDSQHIYVEGIANYQDHIGEVAGEAQIIDSNHFYIEEDGNRLDIIYNEAADTLTVEETGGFGGIGVTFEGTYARSGSIPDAE